MINKLRLFCVSFTFRFWRYALLKSFQHVLSRLVFICRREMVNIFKAVDSLSESPSERNYWENVVSNGEK